MFVPDEEAAQCIEAWLRAAAALGEGLWPGWRPEGCAVGVVLPGGAGLCVRGVAGDPGRPVVGRDGREMPEVRHLGWGDAAFLGLPDPAHLRTRAAAGPEDGEAVAADTVVLGGTEVHLVDAAALGARAAAMARALAARAFAHWWSRREGVGGPTEGGPGPRPEDTPERAALSTVEGLLLLEALRALPDEGPTAAERRARQIALVRRERRVELDDDEMAEEERAEVAEGLPAYVAERAAARVLESGTAGPARGIPDALAAGLPVLGRLAAGRRARLAGWALAELLDRLEDLGEGAPSRAPRRVRPWAEPLRFPEGWKAALGSGRARGFEVLLESHVRFDGGPRDDAALAAALAATEHGRILEAERARAAEAAEARRALVEGILGGSGTLIVLDVGDLGTPEVRAEAPAQQIHAGMAVYPQGASFCYPGGTAIHARQLPLAEDRRAGLLQARVAARLALSGDGGPIRPDEEAVFEEGLQLRLPGLRVDARCGTIRPIDGGYLIRIVR